MDAQLILYGIVGLLVLLVLIKLLKLPIKLLINGVFGVVLLYVANLFGAGIGINIWTALIAGIFGIPGVAVLWIAKLFL